MRRRRRKKRKPQAMKTTRAKILRCACENAADRFRRKP